MKKDPKGDIRRSIFVALESDHEPRKQFSTDVVFDPDKHQVIGVLSHYQKHLHNLLSQLREDLKKEPRGTENYATFWERLEVINYLFSFFLREDHNHSHLEYLIAEDWKIVVKLPSPTKSE